LNGHTFPTILSSSASPLNRKKAQMGEASSNSDPTLPPRKGESEATRVTVGRGPIPPWPPNPAQPPRGPGADAPREPATIVTPRQPPAGAVPHEPTAVPHEPTTVPHEPTTVPHEPTTVPHEPTTVPHEPTTVPHEPTTVPHEPTMVPHEPTMYAPPESAAAAGRRQAPDAAAPQPPASEVVRYGPGVPASQAAVPAGQAGVAAESVWRSGRPPGPPPARARLRRRLGLLLTVILLVAAGVVVYLRFFDHPSLHVTGVEISRPTKTGCTVDVTGRIDTNGGAGTVSYQWVFQPQTQAPQPLSQSLVAGQHTVDVTVAVEGQGHGTVFQRVTLDVLGPGTGTASTTVTISC
jgi:hypothetical protein